MQTVLLFNEPRRFKLEVEDAIIEQTMVFQLEGMEASTIPFLTEPVA